MITLASSSLTGVRVPHARSRAFAGPVVAIVHRRSGHGGHAQAGGAASAHDGREPTVRGIVCVERSWRHTPKLGESDAAYSILRACAACLPLSFFSAPIPPFVLSPFMLHQMALQRSASPWTRGP